MARYDANYNCAGYGLIVNKLKLKGMGSRNNCQCGEGGTAIQGSKTECGDKNAREWGEKLPFMTC